MGPSLGIFYLPDRADTFVLYFQLLGQFWATTYSYGLMTSSGKFLDAFHVDFQSSYFALVAGSLPYFPTGHTHFRQLTRFVYENMDDTIHQDKFWAIQFDSCASLLTTLDLVWSNYVFLWMSLLSYLNDPSAKLFLPFQAHFWRFQQVANGLNNQH